MGDMVSIIMPSYNTAQYIAETIQSVINQTYQNWELIIVDDCSTDDTDIVVGRIKDPRIKYIKNEKNSGAAVSRNRALRAANGRWVAFLDSDDLWKPEKLERQIRFMLKKKCYFSYTNYEEIDSDGNRMNVIVTGPKVITKTGMFNYCWPGCLTIMYDRKKIGLIQIEDIKKNNDYAMWLKVCKKTRCYLLDEVLAEYRRGRSGSISTHGYKELIKWHYRLFRFAEKENVILSMVNTVRNMLFGFYKKKHYVRAQKKKSDICIVGHFGFNEELLNGQTVKTKIVTTELERQLGTDQVMKIDTHGGAKVLPKVSLRLLHALRGCRNVIILPAHNGIRILAPMCSIFNRIYHKKIHYVVIGGWLPEFLKNRKKISRALKTFDGIYVETNTMRKALEAQGFTNVYVMPNFKDLSILKESELVYHHTEPYRLCTFSRVMKEKGIEDAVNAVKIVNEQAGRTVYTLDIYGQIDDTQTEWFDELRSDFPEYVNYRGVVSFDQSVDVLKEYFALIFPTRFFTEGIPGTIIDAYAAGVPVISAEWESFSDVVDKDVTGVGYTFGNFEELCLILKNIALNPQIIQEMKKACIDKAKEFTPEVAIKILIGRQKLI